MKYQIPLMLKGRGSIVNASSRWTARHQGCFGLLRGKFGRGRHQPVCRAGLREGEHPHQRDVSGIVDTELNRALHRNDPALRPR